MKIPVLVALVGIAMALSGCSTNFQDVAAADDGHVYVVGGKVVPFVGWKPKVWRCPEKAPGECQEVSVSE